MYLIHRKIWEFITLVPSLYVQTVQVQKQKKNKQTTKPKTIRNTFILKILETKEKTRKENFHIDSISSLSLSISISPKPSELRALSYLYYDNNNRTQPIIYWRCSIQKTSWKWKHEVDYYLSLNLKKKKTCTKWTIPHTSTGGKVYTWWWLN